MMTVQLLVSPFKVWIHTSATAVFVKHFTPVGTAVYAYGDTNSNHGLFTVVLDNATVGQFRSVTGCGFTYNSAGICERTTPGLTFFAPYLNDSIHTLEITNNAGPNKTFFGARRSSTMLHRS